MLSNILRILLLSTLLSNTSSLFATKETKKESKAEGKEEEETKSKQPKVVIKTGKRSEKTEVNLVETKAMPVQQKLTAEEEEEEKKKDEDIHNRLMEAFVEAVRIEDIENMIAIIDHIYDTRYYDIILRTITKYDRIEVIHEIINDGQGANINNQDSHGHAPIHIAARFNSVHVLDFLINAGAVINLQDIEGNTALHIVARFNSIEALNLLINEGAEINSQNSGGNTPLHIAAGFNSIDAVNFLINAGADLNAQNLQGHTPLHMAAMNGNLEIVQNLIEAGAGYNETALHLAKQYKHKKVIKYLRGLIFVDPTNEDFSFGEEEAKEESKAEGKEEEEEEEEEETKNAVTFKRCNPSEMDVNALFETQASPILTVDAEKRLKEQAFHRQLVKDFSEAARIGDIKSMSVLIEQIDDVHYYNSILRIIAMYDRSEVIEEIFYYRGYTADIDHQDIEGNTPLHIAIKYNSIRVLNYLINDHANINLQNSQGNTPLHIAASLNSIETLNLLMTRGPNSTLQNSEGNTALHIAAAYGRLEIVQRLVESGFVVNARNTRGLTPLDLATQHGHKDVAKFLRKHLLSKMTFSAKLQSMFTGSSPF